MYVGVSFKDQDVHELRATNNTFPTEQEISGVNNVISKIKQAILFLRKMKVCTETDYQQ